MSKTDKACQILELPFKYSDAFMETLKNQEISFHVPEANRKYYGILINYNEYGLIVRMTSHWKINGHGDANSSISDNKTFFSVHRITELRRANRYD